MEPPPTASRAPRATTLTADELEKWNDKDQSLLEALEAWREQAAKARWGANHFVGGFGILPDDHIDRLVRLARRGILINATDLQRELKWHYHAEYNDEVLAVIHSVYPRAVPTQSLVICNQPDPSLPTPTTPITVRKPRTIRCSACKTEGHNGK
jgi:hypothetical protein